ncbi:MAG: glutathione peroxidase [Flavobacteriales bacterium]|nr:glutathione peroxidase [Flavobacteriales bacterium]|tara:strand:+ start:5591 stop:6067 length:477 start_codon:yes stop_codon:yes gene_type:complete
MNNKSIYEIKLKSIDNKPIDLNKFKNKYILFVNVASYCGYTNQYIELQKLYKNYSNLEIIGLPCNQFLFQEPFSEKKIINFCSINYGITFLMTKKIKVKGKYQHDIYKWLTNKDLNDFKNSIVKWNFQKYLVGKDGKLIDYFYSKVMPLSDEITKHLI